jgi:hypothetical protein
VALWLSNGPLWAVALALLALLEGCSDESQALSSPLAHALGKVGVRDAQGHWPVPLRRPLTHLAWLWDSGKLGMGPSRPSETLAVKISEQRHKGQPESHGRAALAQWALWPAVVLQTSVCRSKRAIVILMSLKRTEPPPDPVAPCPSKGARCPFARGAVRPPAPSLAACSTAPETPLSTTSGAHQTISSGKWSHKQSWRRAGKAC